MSKATEPNLNEMIAGDGAHLSMPPAFVFVNPKSARKYKKANQDKVDGRTKGARQMLSRITNRKKMKEELEKQTISEYGVPSETERAQKQIGQMKKLKRQKALQDKKSTAKKSMQDKTSEMDVLMKARLSDFKKKASSQTKKLQKNSAEPEGNIIMENQTMDSLDIALQVATSEMTGTVGETDFAKITFGDGSQQNLDNFSAKKIAACYAQLEGEKQDQYRYMLNKDAATFQSALDFAIRNI
tara:strand:+ start:551 stop:1276 length:726 start_codon:yes stop_codon:yes gene_type:complete